MDIMPDFDLIDREYAYDGAVTLFKYLYIRVLMCVVYVNRDG